MKFIERIISIKSLLGSHQGSVAVKNIGDQKMCKNTIKGRQEQASTTNLWQKLEHFKLED